MRRYLKILAALLGLASGFQVGAALAASDEMVVESSATIEAFGDVEVEEVILDSKSATTKPTLKKVGKIRRTTVKSSPFPNAFSDLVTYEELVPWLVGHTYRIRVGLHKAQRAAIYFPGLLPGNVTFDNERYDALGWTGRKLLTLKPSQVKFINYQNLTLWATHTPTSAGVIVGGVTTYSNDRDLEGRTQRFSFPVIDEQSPTPPQAQPASLTVNVNLPTPPAPATASTTIATPSATTSTHVPAWHMGIDINQGTSNVGGLGDENTRYTATLEHRWHDAAGPGFVSVMGRAGGTPDGWHNLLPVKADDPILQPSVHLGVQSDQDMASIGVGLNIETYIGKTGGVSSEPISLIFRGQKGENWLGMSFVGFAEMDWSVIDELGYTAGLKWSPQPTGFGAMVDINGKLKADVGAGFQPGGGVLYRFDKNTEGALLLRWNVEKPNSPSVGVSLNTQY